MLGVKGKGKKRYKKKRNKRGRNAEEGELGGKQGRRVGKKGGPDQLQEPREPPLPARVFGRRAGWDRKAGHRALGTHMSFRTMSRVTTWMVSGLWSKLRAARVFRMACLSRSSTVGLLSWVRGYGVRKDS